MKSMELEQSQGGERKRGEVGDVSCSSAAEGQQTSQ